MLTSAIFTRTLMLEQKVISPAAFHAVADSEVVTTGASFLHASLVAKMILRRYGGPEECTVSYDGCDETQYTSLGVRRLHVRL